jgi:hypothetical protein
MGKGGGGGGQPAPSSQTVSNTSIPEYARPYVESMLGKSEALTDINQNPYQNYGGQRIAGFNTTQQNAFQEAINRQSASQLAPATNLATSAGLGSLGISGQMAGVGQQYANQATNPFAQQAYMSPYIQNALQPQLEEMQRQYAITGQQEQGKATAAGAFGGTRQALMQAENQRNKNMAMNQAIGSGYQDAFKAAQQAQQFGANLGLQGYQGALSGLGQAGQAASTLGQLGQTQFAQESALNAERQKVGAIQQAQAQQGLDLSYQDFLKQRNYPYQQLAFQSDMLRGLPLSQSARSIYEAPPSAASQLGGLGMSALGIYGQAGGFKAKGGMVGEGYAKGGLLAAQRYKEGGYSIGGKIDMMTAEQLTDMLDNPSLSPLEVDMIENRLMVLARMSNNPATAEIMGGGIDSIPTGDMVPEEGMAGGGIVAFAKGGKSEDDYQTFLENQVRKSIETQLGGNPFAKSEEEKARLEQAIAARQERSPYEALTLAGLGTMAGTSQYGLRNLGLGATEGLKSYSKSKAADTEDRQKMLEQQVIADRAEDARKSGLTGQMQTTLGHMYNKQATLAAAAAAKAAAGSDKDERNLLRAASLIGSDPTIKSLQKQLENSGYQPGSPEYNYYEQRIAERQNQIYKTVGVAVPEITPSNIAFPKPAEKTGFFESLFPKNKPAPSQNKVVPYNQLPNPTKG